LLSRTNLTHISNQFIRLHPTVRYKNEEYAATKQEERFPQRQNGLVIATNGMEKLYMRQIGKRIATTVAMIEKRIATTVAITG
jgi:hypothetical protein